VPAGVALGAINKNGPFRCAPLILSESALVCLRSSEMKMDLRNSLLGEDGVFDNEPIELRKKERSLCLVGCLLNCDGASG